MRAGFNRGSAVRSTAVRSNCVRRARASVQRVLLIMGTKLRMKSSLRAAAEVHRLAMLAAALPTDTRRVFTLHKVYDLTLPEIATRLQLSERAVEQHLVTAALACAGASTAPAAHEDVVGANAPTRIDSSDSTVDDVRTKSPAAGRAPAQPAVRRGRERRSRRVATYRRSRRPRGRGRLPTH